MVELVDTRDLKSLDRNIVPVQVRPRVPYFMKNNWLVATYKTKDINRLKTNLLNQNFDYYLPKITVKKNNSKHKIESLFPSYIFVNIGLENYTPLKYTIGIKDIIKFGDYIPSLSQDDIEKMKIAEEASKLKPIIPLLKIGQEAIISSGTFKGNIVRICTSPTEQRVDALLNILGSARRITFLEKDILP